MTYEQINQLSLEQRSIITQITYRLITDDSISVNYSESQDESDTWHDKMVISNLNNELLETPLLTEYESELVNWKAELTAQEDSRLAEVARKEDLTDRVQAIIDRDCGCPAFYQLRSEPNYLKYLSDLIENTDQKDEAENFISQLESKEAEIIITLQNNEYKALRKAEYGDIGDQLDEIFHDIDTWKARIQAIKDKYPKPE